MEKHKMSSADLVKKMKLQKGITFNKMSEETAIEYLNRHNNYFRIASYRKNYDKHMLGANAGKYIALDFAYLSELSTIDMHLRFLVIKMCLDIEHSLKVKLLTDITDNPDENGYDIVKDFLKNNNWILEDIYHKRFSSYVGNLINSYFRFDTHTSNNNKTIFDNIDINCPVWVFLEIIGFGEFVKLYDYYYSSYPDNSTINKGVLNTVKSLRNACAHNNCVIHNLRKGTTKPSKTITDFVIKVKSISNSERKEKLKIRPLFEIISLLYVYDNSVFDPVKKHRLEELDHLVNNRMIKHREYFENQQIIRASYVFLKKVVDFMK